MGLLPPMSWDAVAAAALLGGWTPGPAVIAVSITQPESSRIANNVQQGQPYATTGWGLWQITPGDSEPQFGINGALLNPVNNAKAGHAKWAGAGGFSPWTTWVNGLNVPFIPNAEAAVAHVAHLTIAQLKAMVGGGGTAPGTPGTPTSTQDWSPQIRKTRGLMAEATGHLSTYARSNSGLKPSFTPPTVTVPNPGTLLWTPGKALPP